MKASKRRKNLQRRIDEWERMPKAGEKDAHGPNAKGTYHHKPGSLNK